MSISNTVTKMDELDYDKDQNNGLEIEVDKTSSETKSEAREEFDASSKSLDATQLYLGEIGFSPLLTADVEVLYARRALRGRAPRGRAGPTGAGGAAPGSAR